MHNREHVGSEGGPRGEVQRRKGAVGREWGECCVKRCHGPLGPTAVCRVVRLYTYLAHSCRIRPQYLKRMHVLRWHIDVRRVHVHTSARTHARTAQVRRHARTHTHTQTHSRTHTHAQDTHTHTHTHYCQPVCAHKSLLGKQFRVMFD